MKRKNALEIAMTATAALAVLNLFFVPTPARSVIALLALVVIAVLFVLRARLGGKWFE